MTDELPAVPDVDPVDELASAVLDGEATADERAAAAADPAVAARLRSFEAVAALVATPVEPPSAASRDAAIAAALAAFGTAEPVDPSVGSAAVDSLAERRARARRTLRWIPAVAAAALALAGIGVVVASAGGDDDEATASAAVTAGASAEADASTNTLAFDDGAGAEPGGAPTAGGGSGAGAASSRSTVAAGDLGAFDDITDLAGAVRSALALAGSGGDSAAPEEQADAATGSSCGLAYEGGVDLAGVASLDGVPVEVVVTVASDGTQQLVAIDAATCEILAELDL